MKWVEIGGTHVNTERLECFSCFDGELHLFFHWDRHEAIIQDPDRKLYVKLCHLLGVRPWEEVRGRWIALDDDFEELEGEEEAKRWACSVCHTMVEYADRTHRSLVTRVCPDCGAKMGEGGRTGNV